VKPKKDSLDHYITDELNKSDSLLLDALKHNMPFKYVSIISKKYVVSNDYLVDVVLDHYNDLRKAGTDVFKAKYLSLRLTHDFVLRNNAKKMIFWKF
jgi:hypothetical protein